jgi:hypothetical protein
MAGDEEMKKRPEEEKAAILWDCGSSLYDSYEIASLGHVLERHTMALPLFCGPRRFTVSPTTSSSEHGRGTLEKEAAVTISVRSSLIRKRRRMNVEMNEMAKKLRSTFSVICSTVGLCKKNDINVKNIENIFTL